SADLAALYGGLCKSKKRDELLNDHKKMIVDGLKTKLIEAGIEMSPERCDKIDKDMEDIISKILPHCAASYEVKAGVLGREVEVQKAVQKEVACQVAVLNECY